MAKDAGAKVKYVQDFGPGVELVAQGRVDAIVNDNIAMLDYLATSGDDRVKIAGDAGDEVLTDPREERTRRFLQRVLDAG